MQRLVEQPAAEGDVLDGNGYVGRVHYHLAVLGSLVILPGNASHLPTSWRT